MIDEHENILVSEDKVADLRKRVSELEIYEKFYKKFLNKLQEKADDTSFINYLNQQITCGATTRIVCQVFSDQVDKMLNATSSLFLLSQDKKILLQQTHPFKNQQNKLITNLLGSPLPLLKIRLPDSKIYSAIVKAGIPFITNEADVIELLLKESLSNCKMEDMARSLLKILEFNAVILLPLKETNETIGLVEIGRGKIFSDYEINRLQVLVDSLGGTILRAINEKKYFDTEVVQTKIIEHADIAIYKQDLNYKIIYYNNKFLEMFGYARDQLEELPISQIIHQTNWEKFEKLCDSSLKVQELMADEFKAISKNKTEVVVKILMRPMIENGEAGGIMAYVWAMEKLKVEKAKIDRLAISRDLIIKELNHRFKNNMVVISSLLALQAKDVTDEKLLSVLKESQNRIRTMTLLHEKLYLTKEMPQLNFAAYIKELATELFHLYNFSPELIKLKMDIAEIELDLDYAVPCGLIINEMISNSLKYAFPTGQKGQIFLKLEPLADEFVLTYGDNGAGLPSDFSFKETTTLGMQIIRLLVEELEGSIELLKDKHTVFQIKFPKLSKAHEG